MGTRTKQRVGDEVPQVSLVDCWNAQEWLRTKHGLRVRLTIRYSYGMDEVIAHVQCIAFRASGEGQYRLVDSRRTYGGRGPANALRWHWRALWDCCNQAEAGDFTLMDAAAFEEFWVKA